ncbi:hypothetical protein CCACVL1_29451 [Corchorus capsularis]|uniref:SWIB domain-containing protein n=1 Tax=Corchorus capsularis TaxID=210143 RepID=A0A1R3G1M0_COCAP|nr:hypothetical protein CCACVL1_29451 [Corchorus capsularis]
MGEKEAPDFWLEESSEKPVAPVSLKRKFKSKTPVFVGWGSKPLIEFLDSIGKDTTEQISRHDVTDIIMKYVNENNLLNPAKKKQILCDERLHSIFGKKTISRIKVYELLEIHYAENQDNWDEEFFFSSEEDNRVEQQKNVVSERKAYQKRKVSETPKSSFAKIVPDNIKLVYLKKSLVEDLLKDSENFEAKVVGSFVRIKPDRFYIHKNTHLLVLVKGLKKASGTNAINADIRFEVHNYVKDVSISMLSDDNFSEEECEDLRKRVKNGQLKRPTIGELEAKAQSLHADITKHWIAKELTLLGKLIERASEKGWRREYPFGLRELLKTPKEQSRLLDEVPNVIADEIEAETAPEEHKKTDNPAISALRGPSEIPSGTAPNGNLATLMPSTTGSGENVQVRSPSMAVQPSVVFSRDNAAAQSPVAISNDSSDSLQDVDVPERLNEPINNNGSAQSTVTISNAQVIDLSDDEEQEEEEQGSNEVEAHDNVNVNILMWHYSDPQGDIQGPFSLNSLKAWYDADYFPSDFKVWKTGENRSKAVLLTDILRQMFHD